MSNRLFQSMLHQMRDVVDRTIGVIDESGTVIACTDLGGIGEIVPGNFSWLITAHGSIGPVPKSMVTPG